MLVNFGIIWKLLKIWLFAVYKILFEEKCTQFITFTADAKLLSDTELCISWHHWIAGFKLNSS